MFSTDAFIDQLLLKAMPDIDDDALDLMKQDVESVLFDRVMTNLLSKLPEDKVQWFVDLIKKNSSESEIQKYINESIPEYEDFIIKVYADFENNYLKNFNQG